MQKLYEGQSVAFTSVNGTIWSPDWKATKEKYNQQKKHISLKCIKSYKPQQ